MADDSPSRYSIDALLNSGVQPFEDLDDEAITALSKGIGRTGPLAVPVQITSDGVLIDGHQRLRAMRTAGRKFIDASDVRIVAQANADNAVEWAVRLNVQRRHLTVEQKATVARRLQRERKWSQRKIADLFGVSQPAVSQWLKDDTDRPSTVIGIDGVEQPVTPPKPKQIRDAPKPGAAVSKETNRITAEVTNPALAQWIAENADDDDRLALAVQWHSIAGAATRIAESLEVIPEEEAEDDDGTITVEYTKQPKSKSF